MLDLLQIAAARYCDSSQQGSRSIKKVTAYLETLSPNTTAENQTEIGTQLLTYCGLHACAMVPLWQLFAGQQELRL